MRHLILLALLVLTYFTVNYMYAAVIKSIWLEGLVPGKAYEYEAVAGLYLVTIPSIIAIALSVPFGILADRFGRVRLIILSGLLMGAGSIIVGLAAGFPELILGFTLFAIGMQGIYPPLMGSIADTTPESRRGLGYAAYYASSVIGYPLGLAAGLTLAWRTGYTLLGLLTIALTAIVSVSLSRIYKSIKHVAVTGGGGFNLRAAGRVVSKPAVIALLVLIFFWGMPWGAVTRYAVNFMEDAWGLSKATASLILTLASISIIIGHITGGALADRRVRAGDQLGRVKVSIIGVGVGLAVMLSFVLYPYPYGVEAPTALLPPALLALAGMLFTTLAYPNISSVLSEVVEREYRATVFSVFNILNTLGWGVGPTLYGWLKESLVEHWGLGIPDASRYSIATVLLAWLIPLAIWVSMLKIYPKSRVVEEAG
ncbi:MAG: MFS transporter [Thermogladius sp.]|nr:MFS transporter [Thermogladius sp.]